MRIVVLGNNNELLVKQINQRFGKIVDISAIETNYDVYLKENCDEEIIYIVSDEIQEIINNYFILPDNLFYLNIYHVPKLNHNIYSISQKGKDRYLYLQKKRCIEKCGNIMKEVGIKKLYIKLISNHVDKTESLEANIIRLLIDNKLDISMLEASSISDLLDEDNGESLYNGLVNMIIFNSYEIQSFFTQISEKVLCDLVGGVRVYNKSFILNIDKNYDINTILYMINSLVFRKKKK